MIDKTLMVGWYCTGKQVDYIRRLAGKPALDVVNQFRAKKGKAPISHLGALTRLEASDIIEELQCSSIGTATSPSSTPKSSQ